MKIIDLTEEKKLITESTSRGTQNKWKINNFWYKEDLLGYEGLAEYLASKILEQSNIPLFVSYDIVKIKTGEKIKNGCVSKDFKPKDAAIHPLQKLFRIYTGENLGKKISKLSDTADRIGYVVDFVESALNISNFGPYLTAMLEFDGIILNEDRHLNNISIIELQSGEMAFCPIFDHGISMLSDVISSPMDIDVFKAIETIEAKPFSRNFLKQIDAAEALYKPQLQIKPCKDLLSRWLNEASEYYDDKVLTRAETVLREQFRKWAVK